MCLAVLTPVVEENLEIKLGSSESGGCGIMRAGTFLGLLSVTYERHGRFSRAGA